MSHRAVHFYSGYISKLFNTDLRLFELGVWLQAFAGALISVFIPIILWKLGLGISQIIIFYILFNFLDVPLNLAAQRFIARFGARSAVILATVSELLYFIILYNLHRSAAMIFFLALFMAIYDSFYWVGHLYIFSSAAHKTSQIRNDVSLLKNIRIFGALVAPLVGAYILAGTNPDTLIFFASLIMLASLIPLFRMRHLKFVPERVSPKFKEFFNSKPEKMNYLFVSLAAVRQETEDVIWPFFLFFIFGSLKTVAAAPVIVALIEFLLISRIGALSKRRNIFKLVGFGALFAAVAWILRLSFYSNWVFALASVAVITFLAICIEVPLEVSIFSRAHETDDLAAVTYMNLFRMLARGLFYALLLLVGNFFFGAFYTVIAVLLIMAVSARILKLKGMST